MLTLLLLPLIAGQSTDFVWLEGEKPASSTVPFETTSCNYPQLLSEGKWLTFSRKKEELPAEGFVLTYRFSSSAGAVDAKARVGFEWVRSAFEWKLNEEAWVEAPATRPTRDPVRLSTWMETGWLDLGPATLKQGDNTLQLRYKPKEDGTVLVGLDAIAFVKPGTHIEGVLRPGENYSSELDDKAKSTRFDLPVPTTGRTSIRLDGAWQVARWDDPNPDASPYEPSKELPKEELRWQGIQVPGDAWTGRPELTFASRLVYRTKVRVPEGPKGFHLHFSGTNWLTSVFVNGTLMGAHKGVLVPWSLDVSKGMRAGENDIAVVVKGPYYARDVGEKDGLLKTRNLPREEGFLKFARWVAPIYPSSKGEGDGTTIGLVNPVTLVGTSDVYVTDAFVRPSVAQKHLDVETSILNSSSSPRKVVVRQVAVPLGGSTEEWQAPDQEVSIAPGETFRLVSGGEWENPKLWWPVRNAAMYRLRTSLLVDGKPADIHEQSFGFREVSIQGRKILINGVARNFWNWVDVTGATTPEEWLAKYEAGNDRFHRFAYDHRVPGVEPHREAQLDWSDRNGIPGRLSTCIDGMFITYDLNKPLVWENFREHLEQVAAAYRNHPSVIVHSAENELMYINAQNLGLVDGAQPKMIEIIRAAQAIDNTRPWMVDGGGSLDGQLPIDCPHYPEGDNRYQPENAYTFFEYANHSKRWPWDRRRPIILGETFFYAGKLEDQAWIGGDEVFRGRHFANQGAAKYARTLIEGFRWQEVAGICPWVGAESVPDAEKAFSSLAAFTRKRAHRLVGGRSNEILVKVFNDTLSDKPVQLAWTLLAAGKKLASGSADFKIRPGYGEEYTIHLLPPAVKARQAAVLRLEVLQEGKVGFSDDKHVSVLPAMAKLTSRVPIRTFDPSGKVSRWLKERGLNPSPLASLDQKSLASVVGKPALLIVGPDALAPNLAYSPLLAHYASLGNAVIVLEQQVPLAGAGLPVPVRSTSRAGGFAFGQAPTSPVFRNLGEGDLEDWAGDFPTFKNVYQKPSGGARCLAQSGEGLNDSPLLELPTGKGVLVLSQLRVVSKLGLEPAADQLLANLVGTYAGYRPAEAKAAVVGSVAVPDGIAAEVVPTLERALSDQYRVAIVQASPANLAWLVQNRQALDRFTANGSWLMLTDLKPEALPAFNRLTGVDELIRPFRVERVVLDQPNHPLAGTLGNRDLSFYSPVEIMHGDYWLSEHVFGHVVGSEDAAPFFRMPGGSENPLEYKPTFSDNDPYNFVNGLLNSDSWRTIRQLWVPEEGELSLEFETRRPESIRQINLWNNTNYSTIRDLEMVFDGDASSVVKVVLPDNGDLTEVRLDPPRKVQKSVRLVVKSWRRPFVVRDGVTLRLVGIDNVQFLRAEVPKGKVALDGVGGLVAYPRGKGGIFLNQLKFESGDPNPANYEKKKRLFATLLANMGVGASTASVVFGGVNAEFAPVDLTRWNNVFIRNREGQRDLFGDGDDLRHLMAGERYYADVPFRLTDYATAPVPQGILQRAGGIEVGRTADALYFLHTAQVTRQPRWDEGPETAHYVVRYEDGSTAKVPVQLGNDLAHWKQKRPEPLPNGRVGWAIPYPGAAADAEVPTLYVSQWSNPKPKIPIRSIDLEPGNSDRVRVLLLGITAARIR